MSQSDKPDELISENYLKLSSVTEKLVATGALNLSSPEDAASERQNREEEKALEREQKRINFWLKDVGVFLLALLLVLLIDVYAFIILISEQSSEGKVRFALAVLTSTITSLLSYLLGRSSK